jgi:hypothetical protein
MIVWGGYNGSALSDGGRYNPAANSWASISASGVPTARYYHTALWTGNEMIVWGGQNSGTSILKDGGRYFPTENSWKSIASSGAPDERALHTAVWTSNQMLIWGGGNTNRNLSDTLTYSLPRTLYLYQKQ